ncbi:MAG: hydrogenase iron-sulfur subunit [Deltaproteobacteria bacterium]|nr:hydrogenase iron-sulfur subunit [Deltaproteobacteria bacterium]
MTESTSQHTPFEPRLVAFLCHYCAFAAADMAGSMRLQYPPNVRNIRLPCTGKLDAGHILRAFEEGADGVMIAGCEEGSCHFLKGNLVAKSRVNWVKTLLAKVGLEPERLHMYNLSSAMGPRWAAIVQEHVERVRALGPSPARAPRPAKSEATK